MRRLCVAREPGDTVPDLQRAIDQGAPLFSGIGDTLPAGLISIVVNTALILSAIDEPPVAAALRRGTRTERLNETVRETIQSVLDASLQAVTTVLDQAGVIVECSAALADPLPLVL
jgi:hypothetical protein